VKRKYRAILSHVLRPADGSPAVLIGDTRVTAMPMMGSRQCGLHHSAATAVRR
jgi:hypothetical protein